MAAECTVRGLGAFRLRKGLSLGLKYLRVFAVQGLRAWTILLCMGLLHTPYIVLTLHPERYIKKRACGLVSRFRRRGRNLNPRLLSLMESFEEPFNPNA